MLGTKPIFARVVVSASLISSGAVSTVCAGKGVVIAVMPTVLGGSAQLAIPAEGTTLLSDQRLKERLCCRVTRIQQIYAQLLERHVAAGTETHRHPNRADQLAADAKRRTSHRITGPVERRTRHVTQVTFDACPERAPTFRFRGLSRRRALEPRM